MKLTRALVAIFFAVALTSCAKYACNLGTFPRAPELGPEPECPAGLVCFSELDAKILGLWLRDVDRWRLRAEGCQ